MFGNFRKSFGSLSVVLLLIFLIGCSGGSNPLTPDKKSNEDSIVESGIYIEGDEFAGEYSLILDADTVSAQIIPSQRNLSLDATRNVSVHIDSLKWDPIDRIWDIVVLLENNLPFDVYRPWIMFTELSNQELLNADIFTWRIKSSGIPQRLSVKEIDKATPKLFEESSREKSHLQLHWPADISSFGPVVFTITVSHPDFRNHPEIPELRVEQSNPSISSITIHGTLIDLQEPPAGVEPFEAWVDLTPVGIQSKGYFEWGGVEGESQEKRGSVVFDADPPSPPVTLTLHVLDWEGYGVEKDVLFGKTDDRVCVSSSLVAEGSSSSVVSSLVSVLRTQQEVDEAWSSLSQSSQSPQISADEMFVLVLGGSSSSSSSSSSSLSDVCVSLNQFDSSLRVEYVDRRNGDCDDADPLVYPGNPFAMYSVPQMDFSSVVVSKKGYDYYQSSSSSGTLLAAGDNSSLHGPYFQLVRTQSELDLLWRLMGSPESSECPGGVCSSSKPVLSSSEVAAVVIEAPQSSRGHFIRPRCIDRDSDGDGLVDFIYDFWSPDASCDVEQVTTVPFAVISFPKDLYSSSMEVKRENPLYSCNTCEPMNPLYEGKDSSITTPFQHVFDNNNSWRTFWLLHAPGSDIPFVDFDGSERVAVVLLGEKPTSGFSVSITCLEIDDSSGSRVLEVKYTEVQLDEERCEIDPVRSSPYSFFTFNDPDYDTVKFTYSWEIDRCEG